MLFKRRSRFWRIKFTHGLKTRVSVWAVSQEGSDEEVYEFLKDRLVESNKLYNSERVGERILHIQAATEGDFRKASESWLKATGDLGWYTKRYGNTLMVDDITLRDRFSDKVMYQESDNKWVQLRKV